MRIAALAVVALGIAGCVTTQEMPLAPNAVRLDTQAAGLLFTGQAVPQTMRRAAQATLARGYTHFRLDGVSMQQGQQFGGVIVQSHGNFATAQSINRPTANAAATVIMYRAGDPGAAGAFDAAQVLRQYGT